MFFAEKIVVFDFMNRSPLKVKRPGGPDENMNFVTQFDQFVGKVGEIDSLSPAVRVAAIA